MMGKETLLSNYSMNYLSKLISEQIAEDRVYQEEMALRYEEEQRYNEEQVYLSEDPYEPAKTELEETNEPSLF
jgi:hypothetical protein